MSPIREYLCDYCGHQFDQVVYGQDPSEYKNIECRCGSMAEVLPALIGGYSGANLSGARKKNSASMPSKKAFTGNTNPFGYEEEKDKDEDNTPSEQ